MRHLIVMVKDPRPRQVKTRLADGIGAISAKWWYLHQSRSILRRMRDPRWHLHLAVAPDRAVGSRVWPGDLSQLPQGGGDVGDRMGRLLTAFAPDPVIIVGSDIPAMQRGHVARAFARLRRSDVVLGPTTDGGFWLIGARGLAARNGFRFAGVRWSTEHALADTMETLAPMTIALADTLWDVDWAEDLKKAPHNGGAEFLRAGSLAARAGWGL